MKFLLILLGYPILISAQVNPAFLVKPNLDYSNMQSSGDGMFGFDSGDKFGYIDKNGNIAIPAEYTYESTSSKIIPGFDRGFVKIKKEGKYGLLDKTGKVTIPFEYDNLYFYPSYKFAAVSKTVGGKNQWGIVSLQNKVIIPLQYEQLQLDSNLIGFKQNGKWGLKDISGNDLMPAEYESMYPYAKSKMVLVQKGPQYGFTDINGKWLFEKAKSVYTLYGVYEDMIECVVSNKYGYLDTKGNEVIMTKYDNANSFDKVGLAKVGKKPATSGSTTLYGYVDKKGNEIIPVKYETIGSFSNGLVYVKDPETNRYGYMDKTGKWIVSPVYLDVNSFDEHGGAWVKQTDGKWHYINKTGKDLGTLDEKETSWKNFLNNGYAIYENADNPYVLIDKNGKVLKNLEDCDGVYNFSEGIAGYKCKSNSQYGFLDLNGNKITSCDFTGFTGFIEGVSKVNKKVDGVHKAGYLDKTGKLFLPVVYDNVYGFRDGWGLIKKENNYFFVNKNGDLKDPPRKYDELLEFRSGYALGKVKGADNTPNTYYYINSQLKEEFSVDARQAYLFWENVAIISRDDKIYELMNKKGEIFKKLDGIDQVKFSSDGMLGFNQNRKWGFINDRGDIIVAAKYDSCETFKNGFGKVRVSGKWGIVDRSGTEILPPKYETIVPCENGLFIFYDKGWGLIDKTGRVLIQPTLSTITTFEKDRGLARLNKTYTIIRSPLLK